MINDHTYGPAGFVTLPDGRRLHYRRRGSGGPAVVFESGMGMSGAIWGLVQPRVAERTTTVVYDRAGLGRSDPDPGPRTLDRLVDDLGHLLRGLPDADPYVLVGASWGGPIIRSLAATGEFPITGLVLVDQSDENASEFFKPRARRQFALTRRLLVPMARTGLTRRLGGRLGRDLPADVLHDHLSLDFGVPAARTMIAELDGFLDDLEKLGRDRPRLDGIEVSVISGTKITRAERNQRPGINRAHRVTAERLDRGRFVPAPDSGHHVMFTEPELVAAEIVRQLPHPEQAPNVH
ncbi:alpha/beta fold hydrolase [Microlunatus sp. GCM10028923]|uniref:alpha/beta fold hydrolase n=1 Tax=Microlunatus sp. GCM10028923 TaxID=3273400 RepID=UPI00361A4AAA